MTAKVFISYRRGDSAAYAGRIKDWLERAFGSDLLFIDVETPLGIDFVDELRKEVATCGALLAVIGPQWLDVRDEDGTRRLENPNDFVRIEIATALERGIPIIPILLDGTSVPKLGQLPTDLQPLAQRQALHLRHTSFRRDMEELISSLKDQLRFKSATPLPSQPYRILSKHITVDIGTRCGSEARIIFEEEILSLQDALSTIRKSFWGDWLPLQISDLRCDMPDGAKVVDLCKEGYANVFLISLDRTYFHEETFPLRSALSVRRGFISKNEYYTYTAIAPVDILVITIILPPGKQFNTKKLKSRIGIAGFHHFKDRQIALDNISENADGRQLVSCQWALAQEGLSYSICWEWCPEFDGILNEEPPPAHSGAHKANST